MRLLRLAIVWSLLVATARADTASDENVESQPEVVQQSAPRGLATIELVFYRGELDLALADIEGFALSPLLSVRYRVVPALEFDVSWGFSGGRTEIRGAFGGSSDGAFLPGNPWLGAHWVGSPDGAPVSLRVGLGVSFPAMQAPEIALEEHADAALVAATPGMRGLWNAWLWLPDTTGIVVDGAAAMRPHEYFAARISAAVAVLVPVRDDDRDTELALQLGVDLALLPIDELTVGVRFQLVFLTDEIADDDQAQTSLEPFLALDVSPVLLRAGLVINLDDPYGTGFGEGDVWGLRFSGSFRF